MSTPTTPSVDVTTSGAEARILDARAYAAAVRAQLDDLAPDVVEELAGGLDADLADLAAESDQPLGVRLGDPARYAAELRAAADLPERVAPRRSLLGSRFSAARSEQVRALQANPWWPTIASVGRDLRPVWWVARAWVAWQLLHVLASSGPLPHSFAGWLSLVVLVAGSIALGRGLFRAWKPVRTLVVLGNAFALLMLPFLLASPASGDAPYAYADSGYSPTQEGLWLGGEQVTNVFPYGPDGQPLTGITLLDQDGRPMAVGQRFSGFFDKKGQFTAQVPALTRDGEIRHNVYPQGTVTVPRGEEGRLFDKFGLNVAPPGTEVEPAAPPRLRVPEIDTGSTGSEPSPTATPDPSGPTSTAPPITPPTTAPPPTSPPTTSP